MELQKGIPTTQRGTVTGASRDICRIVRNIRTYNKYIWLNHLNFVFSI